MRPGRAAVWIRGWRQIRSAIPADAGDRLCHQVEIIGIHARRALTDKVATQKDILFSKLVRIDAHLTRDTVHGALNAPSRLYLARRPSMAGGNFVGINAATLDAQVRNAVAAPRGNHRIVRGGGAAGRVSAGIDDEIHVERRECSIPFDTDLGLEYFGVARVLPKAVFRRRHQPHGSADSS